MQIARIVKGAVSRDFGKTVSEKLNEILCRNPETKLESWQIMKTGDTFCSVLCIFSIPKERDERDKYSTQEERGGQEKGNAPEEPVGN